MQNAEEFHMVYIKQTKDKLLYFLFSKKLLKVTQLCLHCQTAVKLKKSKKFDDSYIYQSRNYNWHHNQETKKIPEGSIFEKFIILKKIIFFRLICSQNSL